MKPIIEKASAKKISNRIYAINGYKLNQKDLQYISEEIENAEIIVSIQFNLCQFIGDIDIMFDEEVNFYYCSFEYLVLKSGKCNFFHCNRLFDENPKFKYSSEPLFEFNKYDKPSTTSKVSTRNSPKENKKIDINESEFDFIIENDKNTYGKPITLTIKDCHFDELALIRSELDFINIKESSVNQFLLTESLISGNKKNNGILECSIRSFTVSKLFYDETILNINYSIIGNLTFSDFTNSELALKFSDCNFLNKISSINSLLSGLEVNRGYWGTKFKFEIEKTTLGEINFRNIGLPNFVIKDQHINTKIEVYRQIRYIAQEANDKVNALKFYGLEMRSYLDFLVLSSNEKRIIEEEQILSVLSPESDQQSGDKVANNSIFHNSPLRYFTLEVVYIVNTFFKIFVRKRRTEIVTVWTQLAFSNFGYSWFRPLVWLLLASVLFTVWGIFQSKTLTLYFGFPNQLIWEVWAKTFTPTTKGIIEIREEVEGVSRGVKIFIPSSIALLYKIFIGFMIFYILKGLRKYTYK